MKYLSKNKLLLKLSLYNTNRLIFNEIPNDKEIIDLLDVCVLEEGNDPLDDVCAAWSTVHDDRLTSNSVTVELDEDDNPEVLAKEFENEIEKIAGSSHIWEILASEGNYQEMLDKLKGLITALDKKNLGTFLQKVQKENQLSFLIVLSKLDNGTKNLILSIYSSDAQEKIKIEFEKLSPKTDQIVEAFADILQMLKG